MKKSTILFNKEHVKSIEFEHRLPAAGIGVRRACPSSKEVLKEFKRQKRARKEQNSVEGEDATSFNTANSTKEIKLDDILTGTETTANGKNLPNTAVDDSGGPDDEEANHKENSKLASASASTAYYQLLVDSKLVQEEIDEIKGIDRSAFNNLPAFLSAPMTQQATKHKILSESLSSPMVMKEATDEESCTPRPSTNNIYMDDELAASWAEKLMKSMKPAEALRATENMRPMAYRLVPEAWSRLRDTAAGFTDKNDDDGKAPSDNNDEEDNNDITPNDDHDKNDLITNDIDSDAPHHRSTSNATSSYIFVDNIRPVPDSSWREVSHGIFYDCLYNQFPKLHISCGAKFGCDYLLYDGNRKVRHAFAGVRVLISKIRRNDDDGGDGQEIDLNIPTAYDLHGYVRGLNTAGKLALLATVIPCADGSGYRVAIVDLALEKILSAPTHLKKGLKSDNARKEIGAKLAKS